MSTHADRCALCSAIRLETVIDLPALPITDTLCADPGITPPESHDQSFRLCGACGHAQLGTWLPPDLLYGATYRYRTSSSTLGRAGIEFFFKSLESFSKRKHYRCIVEVGCNDLLLLERLRPIGGILAGVDPVLADPSIATAEGIRAFPGTLDEVSLETELPEAPDLIICRHTLEHMADPVGTIRRFLDLLAPGGIAVVEVPCLDALLRRGRFDQIFHQHLHYFGQDRLKAAIEDAGGRIEWETLAWQTWGALIVAFSKAETRPRAARTHAALLPPPELRRQYADFRQFMASIGAHLERLRQDGPVYGFGAAQMLPVLAWHLGTNFEWLSAVLDDDRAKHGLRYANLPVHVEYPATGEIWKDATVVITAVDHAPTLIGRLRDPRPRQIVLPLMTI